MDIKALESAMHRAQEEYGRYRCRDTCNAALRAQEAYSEALKAQQTARFERIRNLVKA